MPTDPVGKDYYSDEEIYYANGTSVAELKNQAAATNTLWFYTSISLLFILCAVIVIVFSFRKGRHRS